MFTLQGMRGNVELITEKIRQEAIEEVLEKGNTIRQAKISRQ